MENSQLTTLAGWAFLVLVTACGSRPKASETPSRPPEGPDVATAVLVDRDPSQGLELGHGYNSIGGEAYSLALGTCAAKAPTATLAGSTGSSVIVRLDGAGNELELLDLQSRYLTPTLATLDEANVSVADEADSGAALAAASRILSAREDGSLYQSKLVGVVVRVERVSPISSMISHRLDDSTIARFAAAPQEFVKSCGDRFVSGTSQGVAATITLRCEVDGEQWQGLVSSVKEKSGYLGLGGVTKIQETIDHIRRQAKSCTAEVMHKGGAKSSGGTPLASVAQYAVDFVNNAQPETNVVLALETLPYSVILNRDFQDRTFNQATLDLGKARQFVAAKVQVMNALGQQVLRLIEGDQATASTLTPLLDGVQAAKKEAEDCLTHIGQPKACHSEAAARSLR